MANRTYLIWYRKPETVPYPILILEDGYAHLAYQDRPGHAELLTHEDGGFAYTERNTTGTSWKSLSRCEARKFMRKHYPDFDVKLL